MSRMVTTCANCRQQLAVTAADLRIGQGYVRCGRCDKVFNALLTLAEDEPAPTEPDSVAHGTRSVPMLADDDLPPIPGREEPLPFGSAADDDDEIEVIQTHVTGSFRGIGSEDAASADITQGGEPPDLATDPLSIRTEPDAVGAEDRSVELQRETVAREIIRQATSQPIDVLLEEPPDAPSTPRAHADAATAEFDADLAIGNARPASRLWGVMAVLLLLALAAQWVHHQRHRLVGVPWLEAPLGLVYGLFGQTVDPDWDLGHYDVQLLAAQETPGAATTLVLQAAVAVNRDARWAQPPPLLRVTLTDVWGNVVQTTDVPPRDWMLGEALPRLSPGQRVDARLTLPAAPRASGSSLAACLPDETGALRCRDGS